MPLTREYIDTEKSLGFSQAVAVEANGTRTIYLSGQTGHSEGLGAQSNEAFANLARRIEAAGATPDDVVKLTTYIVDYSPDKVRDAFSGFVKVFNNPDSLPANTLIGVQALFQPHLLIEVEAIAVVET